MSPRPVRDAHRIAGGGLPSARAGACRSSRADANFISRRLAAHSPPLAEAAVTSPNRSPRVASRGVGPVITDALSMTRSEGMAARSTQRHRRAVRGRLGLRVGRAASCSQQQDANIALRTLARDGHAHPCAANRAPRRMPERPVTTVVCFVARARAFEQSRRAFARCTFSSHMLRFDRPNAGMRRLDHLHVHVSVPLYASPARPTFRECSVLVQSAGPRLGMKVRAHGFDQPTRGVLTCSWHPSRTSTSSRFLRAPRRRFLAKRICAGPFISQAMVAGATFIDRQVPTTRTARCRRRAHSLRAAHRDLTQGGTRGRLEESAPSSAAASTSRSRLACR